MRANGDWKYANEKTVHMIHQLRLSYDNPCISITSVLPFNSFAFYKLLLPDQSLNFFPVNTNM